MTRLLKTVAVSVGALGLWSPVALAAPPEKLSVDEVSEALNSGNQPAAATIDKIMEQAVRNIARRYNLNDVQTDKTNELMKREVYNFIREHESEIWPAIKDLLQSGLGTRPPESPEEIQRIGKAARPLARLAEEAIYRANDEWRLILTDEQKKVHDFDMSEMRTTFEEIDKNFAEWEQGKASERIFPQPNMGGKDLPRPTKPPPGKLPEPRNVTFDPSNIFETLAEEFIEEYGLDDGQVTSARSIVEEFKGKASDFLDANKVAIAQIDLRRQQAREARDMDAIKQVNADHKKLLEPVYQLCSAMEDRLEGLLTTAQIQRHKERGDSPVSAKRTRDRDKSAPIKAGTDGNANPGKSSPGKDTGNG